MKHSTRRAPTAARLAALIAAGLALGATQQVMAAGTASGTSISNLSTLSYSVGGVTQANIGSSETGNTTGAGTPTTFAVDNKVNLTLTETGNTYTSVSPGATAQVTAFALTNLGNTAQGYNLTAANVSATVFGVADSFDVTGVSIYLDANSNGVLDPAESGAGAITSLATVAPDATVALLVVANIPAGQANGTQSSVSLTALAREENTLVALTEAANTQAGVEIVFADAATTANVSGTDPGQTARDATAFAYDAYRVAAAIISVSKTATVICDPFNGTTGPKNIPGAIVRWTITVSNSGTAGASATLNQVTDSLDLNTLHDANLVTGAGAPVATACNSATGTPEGGVGLGFQIESSATRALGGTGGYMTTSAADSDGAGITGQNVTIDFAAALPVDVPNSHAAGELKAGESATVTFNVTIN